MADYGWTLKVRRKGFDPNQPRDPAGSPTGGQWTSSGDGGTVGATRNGKGDVVSGTVYRGAQDEAGFENSAGWDFGVYVSTSAADAAQWGDVRAFTLKKPKKVLDLGNWHSAALAMVAKETGQRAGDMSFSDYDQVAGELFIQMPKSFAMRAKKYGFDGIRLGNDVFLFGKLSDHATRVK